jgi:1,4-dihydroxy-2-naphthoate octaprenyltransferase
LAKFSSLFRATRPQFLLLTPVCFMVGAVLALKWGEQTDFVYFALALIGALAAHISVNTLNDYFDFASGLDLITKPTPFSGGGGTIVQKHLPSKTVLALGLGSLAVAIGIAGAFVAKYQSWTLVWIAVPAAILIVFYTQYITRSPLLCLIAPGLGFGPLMVLGAFYALNGSFEVNGSLEVATTVLAASMVPGFLVSNLLLLNQFPDIEADKTVGRRVLPGLIGRHAGAKLYALIVFCTYGWIALGVGLKLLPIGSLLALLPVPLAFGNVMGVLKHAEDREGLIPLMGKNVLLTLVTPVLLAIGLALSGL